MHVQDSHASSPRSDFPLSELRASSSDPNVDYMVPLDFGVTVLTASISENTLRTAVSKASVGESFGGATGNDALPRGMETILKEKRIKMSPTENIANLRGRSLFATNEIYGLMYDSLKGADELEVDEGSAKVDADADTDANADVAQGARDTEKNAEEDKNKAGKKKPKAPVITTNEDEWCVICLTDPKVVVLLPCRHMCVCQDCLVHVATCPICRAPFDEYAVKQDEKPMTCSLPSPCPSPCP